MADHANRPDEPSGADEGRRLFLQRGLLGGALLVLGGAATLAGWPGKQFVEVAPQALRALTPRTFQVVVAIAARVVVDPAADPVAVAHGVDRALAYASPDAREDLRKLLMLFENALPGLLDFHVLPFTRLDPGAQDAVLARWRDSRIALRRGGYHALRKLCLAAWYATPAAWPAIGYPGPPNFGGLVYDDSKAGVAPTQPAKEERP